MKQPSIIIRPAAVEDSDAILDIYKPYIETTSITFEYDVPSSEAFRRRIAGILEKFPYLVAIDKDSNKIIGYAYANTFRKRAAYGRCAELSIYLSPYYKGQGIGRRLYNALERILFHQNIINMVVAITDSAEKDDIHNTNDSFSFHKSMGFSLVGAFTKCGYKFGKLYNVIYMEKFLSCHSPFPAEVKTFEEIRHLINFGDF